VNLFRTIKLTASSLVFPLYCPACGKIWYNGTGWICPNCWDTLSPPGRGTWYHIRSLKGKVLVAFQYSEITRNLVHYLKFYGRVDIASESGKWAVGRLKDELSGIHLKGIVPVPLHPVRVRERGYDQNLIIAHSVADQLELPVFDNIIKRIRNTPPQSRLSDNERRRNISDAFAPEKESISLKQGTLLLVDDVIHTGATVLGCIKAIRKAGFRDVMVLAVFG